MTSAANPQIESRYMHIGDMVNYRIAPFPTVPDHDARTGLVLRYRAQGVRLQPHVRVSELLFLAFYVCLHLNSRMKHTVLVARSEAQQFA